MTPEFILTNDSEQLVGHDGPVVLLVSKRMVKSRNIAFALNALMTLTESAEMVRRFHGKLHFVVSGYEKDHRELPQIPEVRRYFAAIAQEWPHWLWFLARECEQIGLLLMMLMDVQLVQQGGGQAGYFIDPGEMKRVLFDLFDRENIMLEALGISEAEISAACDSAMADLEGMH